MDIAHYHRGDKTPPSAQEVRSALRLLKQRRPGSAGTSLASTTLGTSPAGKTKKTAPQAPVLAWSKPAGGSVSSSPAAPLHCLRTSACRCNKCSADAAALCEPGEAPPQSVHTEDVGRTLSLTDAEVTAASTERTEVRCRLDDQFADAMAAPVGVGYQPWEDAIIAGTANDGAMPAPPQGASAPRTPPPSSRPALAWVYGAALGKADASPGDEEEVESLASLRSKVALAAQKCKAINRLCISELAHDDAGAVDAADRRMQAGDPWPPPAPPPPPLSAPEDRWLLGRGSGLDERTPPSHYEARLASTAPASCVESDAAMPPQGEGRGAGSGAGAACGQWLAERILASSSHKGGGRGWPSALSGASLYQPPLCQPLVHQPPVNQPPGSLLHSPETLGPFGPAPEAPDSLPQAEATTRGLALTPPRPTARPAPTVAPTNPFSSNPFSRPSTAQAEPAGEDNPFASPTNPFSPAVPAVADRAATRTRNPFSPGVADVDAAFAASTTEAYTSDDDDGPAAAAAGAARAVPPRKTNPAFLPPLPPRAGPAAAAGADNAARNLIDNPTCWGESPEAPGRRLQAARLAAGVAPAPLAAGARRAAAAPAPMPSPPDESPQSCCTPTPMAGACDDAGAGGTPGSESTLPPNAAAPRPEADAPTPSFLHKPKGATPPKAADAVKRAAERRAAAARNREEVRKYLAVERALSEVAPATPLTAPAAAANAAAPHGEGRRHAAQLVGLHREERQRRDELLGVACDVTLLLCDLAHEAVDQAEAAASTPVGRQVKEMARRLQAAREERSSPAPPPPASPPLDAPPLERGRSARAPELLEARAPARPRVRRSNSLPAARWSSTPVPVASDEQLEGWFQTEGEAEGDAALLSASRSRSRWRLLRQQVKRKLRSTPRASLAV
eukprot:Transcript_18975.p1 GENE.Transcript_18975~~Transcript_18975.p1  ORF type:complete len:912 (-),score=240.42 Transcript_18975:154-2865(-)